MQDRRFFFNLYNHGLIRVAVATPELRVADPAFNAATKLELARQADQRGAVLTLFPELSLSSYTNDELFHQRALLDATLVELAGLIAASRDLTTALIVGAPLRHAGRLYNCAVMVHRGRILGVVPKTYLPNYREYYEKRYFASGAGLHGQDIQLCGSRVPFGPDLLFRAADIENFVLGIEICEDLWAPIPPSSRQALAGATIIANLSASNITVGKAEQRKLLCQSQASRNGVVYLYSAAGQGESTTDLAWDGQAGIFEPEGVVAEAERFVGTSHMIVADVDLDAIEQSRARNGTFADNSAHESGNGFRVVEFAAAPPRDHDIGLLRPLARFPFVPSDPARLDLDCYEAYNIQVNGLVTRLKSTGIKKIVIGVSGGLDSTHALIVCVRAMDRLALPRTNILAYTLPGFGTSSGTKDNAWRLMRALGVTAQEIDIRDVALRTLEDIGHTATTGAENYDITYENVQAGARTAYLFRLANLNDGIVVGTGDLSELALGWCTYGVGDQMAHYNVNGSVPKTLIQHLIRWVAANGEFGPDASRTLLDVLATEISPELIPAGAGGAIQSTESTIGPYELQDFNLYYLTRFGFLPSKIAFLAWHAWRDRSLGTWPAGIDPDKRHQYDLATIKRWLGVFLLRFIQTSQFKRSAMPNGPKVVPGSSLSPRGDWRAPSDASASAWLAELRDNVP